MWAAQKTHELARELGAPDLKEPSWYALVGTDYQAPPPLSPEGQKIATRKARKLARRRNYPSHGPSSFLDALKAAA